MKILDRFMGSVIFESKKELLERVILEAVQEKVSLYGANLSCADLSCANLSCADLSGANLYGAKLSGADLSGANLSCADLSGANLYGANLYGANLYGANLSSANLYGADLSGANLSGANLQDVKNGDLVLAKTSIVPEEGAFIGYKKLSNGIIAKLIIPHDAKRLNSYGSRKCRAEKVFVLEGEGCSSRNGTMKYAPENWVISDSFDDDRRTECSHGIHFFITRIEAENY